MAARKVDVEGGEVAAACTDKPEKEPKPETEPEPFPEKNAVGLGAKSFDEGDSVTFMVKPIRDRERAVCCRRLLIAAVAFVGLAMVVLAALSHDDSWGKGLLDPEDGQQDDTNATKTSPAATWNSEKYQDEDAHIGATPAPTRTTVDDDDDEMGHQDGQEQRVEDEDEDDYDDDEEYSQLSDADLEDSTYATEPKAAVLEAKAKAIRGEDDDDDDDDDDEHFVAKHRLAVDRIFKAGSMPVRRAKIERLLTRPGFSQLRGTCPVEWPWFSEMPAPSACLAFNLYLLKGPKTGSSTMAGITRRIGARYGLSGVETVFMPKRTPFPRVLASHVRPANTLAASEAREPTYEFGFVRDPVERCLSNFYHFSFRDGTSQDDDAVIAFADGLHCSNFIFHYYGMSARMSGRRPGVDLMGVTERAHESIVLLGLELGLSMGDLLYVPAKVSTQLSGDPSRRHKSFLEHGPKVRKYFMHKFVANNINEILLYKAANKVLDERIDSHGRAAFQALVETFTAHVDASHAACAQFDDAGRQVMTDCYRSDHGCHKRCLNAYATMHNLWAPLPETLSAHNN